MPERQSRGSAPPGPRWTGRDDTLAAEQAAAADIDGLHGAASTREALAVIAGALLKNHLLGIVFAPTQQLQALPLPLLNRQYLVGAAAVAVSRLLDCQNTLPLNSVSRRNLLEKYLPLLSVNRLHLLLEQNLPLWLNSVGWRGLLEQYLSLRLVVGRGLLLEQDLLLGLVQGLLLALLTTRVWQFLGQRQLLLRLVIDLLRLAAVTAVVLLGNGHWLLNDLLLRIAGVNRLRAQANQAG